jgi:hypothetical protein
MPTELPIPKAVNRRNLVIREVCDRHGNVLDYLVVAHDGSPESMIQAAKRVSERMFELFEDASNIASQILATDDVGVPRWSISPNFKLLTEI